MRIWPHSWVAYIAGCKCDECLAFDRLCFDGRNEIWSANLHSTRIQTGDGEPKIATQGGVSS